MALLTLESQNVGSEAKIMCIPPLPMSKREVAQVKFETCD